MDNSEKMFELADRLKALRDEKKDTEQRVKELNAALEETDAALAQLMTDTETQNFTRSGTMFCLTNTTRASATADRKDELFEALRAEGYGGLVYETVNANSLSAFVREQISENDDVLPDWLEGLVSVFEKTTVGVRKATRK
jgi:histidinol-phosphate/aromatic aminotransferase/cobyric acid decarboxylase-like protein